MKRDLAAPIATILFIAAAAQAAAQSTEIDATEPPNLYDLAGRNLTIHYSTSSFGGQPLLGFVRRSGRLREFQGEEIRVEETEIGQLVSVTFREIPDMRLITLNLLIPDINLPDGEPVMFESRVFFTSHHTTIGGQDLVMGPLQTYYSPQVFGQASSVDFLVEDSAGVFGKVTQSPTCPGPQQPGQKCAGPLADAEAQLLDEAENVVATGMTDAAGLFSIQVEPGEYTLVIDTGGTFPSCPPKAVTVEDYRITTVNVKCDTGIR